MRILSRLIQIPKQQSVCTDYWNMLPLHRTSVGISRLGHENLSPRGRTHGLFQPAMTLPVTNRRVDSYIEEQDWPCVASADLEDTSTKFPNKRQWYWET